MILSRLALRAAARPVLTFSLTGLLFASAYVTAVLAFPRADSRVVVGDAVHHFVQLRSLMYDGDLRFQNEYVRLYGLGGPNARVAGDQWIYDDLTPTGHVRNYTPVGPALLWAPLYALLSAVLWIGAQAGLNAPPSGYEPLLQLAPGLTGVAAATGAAILSARLAARWTSQEWATGATLAIWLGSPALYYSLVSPAYSHAPSMLAVSILLLHWSGGSASQAPVRATWFGLSGLLAGVASLMRWQDAIFVALPLYVALWQSRPVAARVRAAAIVLAGWLVAFLPQMAVWQVLYGKPLTVPQGTGFMAWTRPSLVSVLFSANHGLFTWTPVLLLAVAGLVMLVRHERRLAVPLSVVLLTSWWVNASVADWWAGEAYGARRFLSLFPLFATGLAAWMPGDGLIRHRQRAWVVAALVAANFLLLLQYQLFMKGFLDIAPYPQEWFDLWIARFVVPFKVIAKWML